MAPPLKTLTSVCVKASVGASSSDAANIARASTLRIQPYLPVSIKIVCVDRGAAFDALQALGPYGQYTILVLQNTFDEQERLADHGHPIAIEEVGPHDDIGH